MLRGSGRDPWDAADAVLAALGPLRTTWRSTPARFNARLSPFTLTLYLAANSRRDNVSFSASSAAHHELLSSRGLASHLYSNTPNVKGA